MECLMACGCRKKPQFKYKWTSADGSSTVTYDNEIVAKAKVSRKGGTYEPIPA